MVTTEQALIEEIRTIIAHNRDVTHAWEDEQVVREAERRLCSKGGDRNVRQLIAGMPDYWLAVVQQARQAGRRNAAS